MIPSHRIAPTVDTQRAGLPAVLAGVLVITMGCGVGAELEECKTRLTATEAERARLDQDLAALRDDYKEVLRSFAVTPPGESVTAELRGDVEQQIAVVRDRVAEQVPPLVREQLEKELESLLATLDRQFGTIDAQYSRISGRLDEVRGSLDIANERLEGIEISGQGLSRQITEQRVDVERLQLEVDAIATSIQNFDEARFLCRECAAHLDIRSKRAEPILAFHADLKSMLRRLPTRIAGAGAGFGDDFEADEAGADQEEGAATPDEAGDAGS